MLGSKDEITKRRVISPLPQRLCFSDPGSRVAEGKATVSCPFCHKAVARFRLMDSTYHSEGFVRVAYFT